MDGTPITTGQIKKLYAEAGERGIDNEALHNFVYKITKKESIKLLTKEEGSTVISVIISPEKESHGNMITNKQLAFIQGLAEELNWKEPERLQGFIKKVGGVDNIKFLTRSRASDVIEGLKKLKQKGGYSLNGVSAKVQ